MKNSRSSSLSIEKGRAISFKWRDLQHRDERDKEDIGRLLMLANQYKDTATRRAKMAKANRLLMDGEQKLCEEKGKLIEDLQCKLDARDDNVD